MVIQKSGGGADQPFISQMQPGQMNRSLALGHPAGLNRDIFQRSEPQTVLKGVYLPHNNDTFVVPIEIDANGTIYQKGLNGLEPAGRLDTYGNFRLNNGQQGNYFRDGFLDLNIMGTETPFVMALRETQRVRASVGSEIPEIRQYLTSQGITGAGITVVDIEPFKEKKKDKPGDGESSGDKSISDGQIELSDHSRSVGSIVNDPDWGVAPGAKVLNYGWNHPDIETKDDITDFNQLPSVQAVYQNGIQQLQRVIQSNDPSQRVVNLSWGTSLIETYQAVYSKLQARDDNGNYKLPNLRQGILGETQYGTEDEQFQSVVNYVTHLMSRNPVFNQLHQQFIETSRQAARKGIVIFASAANSHTLHRFNAVLPPAAEMSVWSASPYVIPVASSDTNLTPRDRSDDTIADHSSRGDGRSINPAFAAPGQEIGFSHPSGPLARNNVSAGTSYASPFAAGLCALMLQREPWLTFDQVKQKFTAACTPTGAGIAAEGAGMLNPVQTVLGMPSPQHANYALAGGP